MSHLALFILGLIIGFIFFSYTGKPDFPLHYHGHLDISGTWHDIVVHDNGSTIEFEYFINDEAQLYIHQYKEDQ